MQMNPHRQSIADSLINYWTAFLNPCDYFFSPTTSIMDCAWAQYLKYEEYYFFFICLQKRKEKTTD